MEYSFLLNIINKDIEEANDKIINTDSVPGSNNNGELKVNLPSHLKNK